MIRICFQVFSQPGLVDMVRSADNGLDKGCASNSGLTGCSINMPSVMSNIEVDENISAAARYHLQVNKPIPCNKTMFYFNL